MNTKLTWHWTVMLITCLCLTCALVLVEAPLALAQEGEEGGDTGETGETGEGEGSEEEPIDWGYLPKGFSQGEKTGWGESEVPPGWSQGEKTGWGDLNKPPGLAKKDVVGDPEPGETPEGEGGTGEETPETPSLEGAPEGDVNEAQGAKVKDKVHVKNDKAKGSLKKGDANGKPKAPKFAHKGGGAKAPKFSKKGGGQKAPKFSNKGRSGGPKFSNKGGSAFSGGSGGKGKAKGKK